MSCAARAYVWRRASLAQNPIRTRGKTPSKFFAQWRCPGDRRSQQDQLARRRRRILEIVKSEIGVAQGVDQTCLRWQSCPSNFPKTTSGGSRRLAALLRVGTYAKPRGNWWRPSRRPMPKAHVRWTGSLNGSRTTGSHREARHGESRPGIDRPDNGSKFEQAASSDRRELEASLETGGRCSNAALSGWRCREPGAN